jgi:glyoxylase-like metal-dependent hydrolase (beta-lactamase superfamily II)
MDHDQIRPIDVRHRGRSRVIAAWLVGDVLVDCGPASCLDALLEGLGEIRPRALALTHIHLDHAGAAGTLVERFPDLEVWVHELGAHHMIDPTRLLASAKRLYGDAMDELWGEFKPVPEANVRELRGGEQIGAFEVAYTPGHASHHVSYLHTPTRTALVGDVAGVRITPSDYILAPTPPPDIDVEAWHASLDIVRAWQPSALAVTHFGLFGDVTGHLDGLLRALDTSAERARTMDVDEFVRVTATEIGGAGDRETVGCYTTGAPLDQTYAGLARYWSKREVAQ